MSSAPLLLKSQGLWRRGACGLNYLLFLGPARQTWHLRYAANHPWSYTNRSLLECCDPALHRTLTPLRSYPQLWAVERWSREWLPNQWDPRRLGIGTEYPSASINNHSLPLYSLGNAAAGAFWAVRVAWDEDCLKRGNVYSNWLQETPDCQCAASSPQFVVA